MLATPQNQGSAPTQHASTADKTPGNCEPETIETTPEPISWCYWAIWENPDTSMATYQNTNSRHTYEEWRNKRLTTTVRQGYLSATGNLVDTIFEARKFPTETAAQDAFAKSRYNNDNWNAELNPLLDEFE